MTCTEMCGSGAQTGIVRTTTRIPPSTTQLVRRPADYVCHGVAVGTVILDFAARQSVARGCHLAGFTILDFVSCAVLNDELRGWDRTRTCDGIRVVLDMAGCGPCLPLSHGYSLRENGGVIGQHRAGR